MDENNKLNSVVVTKDFILPVSTQILRLPVTHPPVPKPSSSITTTYIEDIESLGADIEISLETNKKPSESSSPYSNTSGSSSLISFQHDIAALPWSLFRSLPADNDVTISGLAPQVKRAAVSFSFAPASVFSRFCLGSSTEIAYDAILIFTLWNNSYLSYRIDSSTEVSIANPLIYNLSHREITLTETELDTETFYARHLVMMKSYAVSKWSPFHLPYRFLCGEIERDDGMMKKDVVIPHECLYIVHLVNHFIPREKRINPEIIRSPHDLYLQLQQAYQKLYS
jgi:hypothetical protein